MQTNQTCLKREKGETWEGIPCWGRREPRRRGEEEGSKGRPKRGIKGLVGSLEGQQGGQGGDQGEKQHPQTSDGWGFNPTHKQRQFKAAMGGGGCLCSMTRCTQAHALVQRHPRSNLLPRAMPQQTKNRGKGGK